MFTRGYPSSDTVRGVFSCARNGAFFDGFFSYSEPQWILGEKTVKHLYLTATSKLFPNILTWGVPKKIIYLMGKTMNIIYKWMIFDCHLCNLFNPNATWGNMTNMDPDDIKHSRYFREGPRYRQWIITSFIND